MKRCGKYIIKLNFYNLDIEPNSLPIIIKKLPNLKHLDLSRLILTPKDLDLIQPFINQNILTLVLGFKVELYDVKFFFSNY